jgi:hypothetical protein
MYSLAVMAMIRPAGNVKSATIAKLQPPSRSPRSSLIV